MNGRKNFKTVNVIITGQKGAAFFISFEDTNEIAPAKSIR
jgi:hypothetical protein